MSLLPICPGAAGSISTDRIVSRVDQARDAGRIARVFQRFNAHPIRSGAVSFKTVQQNGNRMLCHGVEVKHRQLIARHKFCFFTIQQKRDSIRIVGVTEACAAVQRRTGSLSSRVLINCGIIEEAGITAAFVHRFVREFLRPASGRFYRYPVRR